MLISLAERAAQQIEHARDQPVHVEAYRLERLAAGEGEQPLRELRRALRALRGSVERLLSAFARARRPAPGLARSASWRLMVSRLPTMMVSRLLKSCATPPVSWPTASIFCACRTASLRLVAQFRFVLELAGARDETLDGVPRRDGEKAAKVAPREARARSGRRANSASSSRARLALGEQLALGFQDRQRAMFSRMPLINCRPATN